MKVFGDRSVVVGSPREGGMSKVYPGIDTKQNGKKVAVKLFTRGKFEDDILHEAYDREIRALKDLKHPNIVELLDFGKDDAAGSEFLVLEWVESNLSEKWKKGAFAGWDSFFEDFGLPVLKALEFAHRRQVIHRDLKTREYLDRLFRGSETRGFRNFEDKDMAYARLNAERIRICAFRSP